MWHVLWNQTPVYLPPPNRIVKKKCGVGQGSLCIIRFLMYANLLSCCSFNNFNATRDFFSELVIFPLLQWCPNHGQRAISDPCRNVIQPFETLAYIAKLSRRVGVARDMYVAKEYGPYAENVRHHCWFPVQSFSLLVFVLPRSQSLSLSLFRTSWWAEALEKDWATDLANIFYFWKW